MKQRVRELNYIGAMPWISQSTVVASRPFDLLQSLGDRPKVKMIKPKASLCYTIIEPLQLGAVVEYTLSFGMQKVAWTGKVTQLNGTEEFSVNASESAHFQLFRSHHVLKEFGGNTILREQIEFSSPLEQLEALLENASIDHSLEHRNTISNRKTEQMQSIGQQSA